MQFFGLKIFLFCFGTSSSHTVLVVVVGTEQTQDIRDDSNFGYRDDNEYLTVKFKQDFIRVTDNLNNPFLILF